MGRLLAHRRRGVPNIDFQVSPLGRARETAGIVMAAVPDASVILEPRLREVSIGSWDGLTDFDIDALYPGARDGATRFDWYFRSPNGETYEHAASRARDWLDGVEGAIVAVSHGLFSRFIRGAYLGFERAEALSLPAPHGVIWRLKNGTVEEIA